MYEIMIKTEFAAAHHLRNYQGACEAIHGHNWKVDIHVESKTLDDAGLAIDFKELKDKANHIINELDHTFINENPAFFDISPSSENIARYIYDHLKTEINGAAKLKKVTVWETDDAAASYREGD